jgi:hypothetical protein
LTENFKTLEGLSAWVVFIIEARMSGRSIMAILVVEFSREGYKIRNIFWLKNNCSHVKSLNFDNWCNGEVSKIGHHFRK